MARKARSSESYALKYAPYFSIAGFDRTICDFRTIVQTIRREDHLLRPVLEEGEELFDVGVAPAIDSGAIVRAVVRLIEHNHVLPGFAQGFDVRRRIVDVDRGLHTVFQPSEAQAHVRNVIAIQPLRGVGNDHLMLAGHEQPMRDDANVHVLARQSLQRLRYPRKRLHRRIQMLTFRGFMRFDVIVKRVERPPILASEIVMRGLQRTFRHVNALPMQVIADRTLVIRADPVQIEIEHAISLYAHALTLVLFRNSHHITFLSYVRRRSARRTATLISPLSIQCNLTFAGNKRKYSRK